VPPLPYSGLSGAGDCSGQVHYRNGNRYAEPASCFALRTNSAPPKRPGVPPIKDKSWLDVKADIAHCRFSGLHSDRYKAEAFSVYVLE